DFAVAANFPVYDEKPEQAFMYLETRDRHTFDFQAYTLPDASRGRWFLMEAGDVDADGDEDLLVSTFSYSFMPVPDSLEARWKTDSSDVYLFRNT
ncbi:MAG: VCBS repeat-containing protein, partial [Bacteroidota bacterium]